MELLIAGVLLWSVAHLFPSLGPSRRTALIERLGEGPYKGLFALTIVASIVLIVLGWRSVSPTILYTPPLLQHPLVPALLFVSFVLFAGASAPGNIKRWLRHPMLTGMTVWAGAHLLANGDDRSLVLFGGLGVWALLSMFTLSRRDGPWQRPPAVPMVKDLMTIAASALIFGLVAWAHKWVIGVAAIPGWS